MDIPREGRLVVAACSLGWRPPFGGAIRERELTDSMLPAFGSGGMAVRTMQLEPAHVHLYQLIAVTNFMVAYLHTFLPA